MNQIVKTAFDAVTIDDEAKKALLLHREWIDCIIMQLTNRLPNENLCQHLRNICINIANYSNSQYPYPGYCDILDAVNTTAIRIGTAYIDYVCSNR